MEETQDSTATAEATAEQAEPTESQEQDLQAGSRQEDEGQDGSHKEGEVTGYDLVIPEGYQLDDAGVDDFKKFATDELGLDGEKSQKMLDRYLTKLDEAVGRDADSVAAVHQEWAKESMNDKEFGGADLQENMVRARRTMNSFSDPAVGADGKAILHSDGTMKGQQMTEVEVLLNRTGMGNNPALIRVFHRMGLAMSEDHYVKGDMKPVVRKKTPAEVMYPNMNK